MSVVDPRAGPSRSPSRSPQPVSAARKNFSFLLRPDNFHALSDQDVPAPFLDPITIEPSEAVLSKAISEGRFRTAAILAADLLKSKSDPSDGASIFALLEARLACLQLSGLDGLAAQESKALQDLNAPIYREDLTGRNLVPWNLRVITVRLQALGFGDWRRAVMAYYDLAREARFESRRTKGAEQQQWVSRLHDVGVRVANALVDMGDLEGAARFLTSLPTAQSPRTRQRLALVFLNAGDVPRARQQLALDGQEVQHHLVAALCDMVEGDYATALRDLEALQAQHSNLAPLIAQNTAACLVYMGRIQEVT